MHECKLNFLRILCDHDLFVEMPGRDPTERYVVGFSALCSSREIPDLKLLDLFSSGFFCRICKLIDDFLPVLFSELF